MISNRVIKEGVYFREYESMYNSMPYDPEKGWHMVHLNG
jgi:hypothetical protein